MDTDELLDSIEAARKVLDDADVPEDRMIAFYFLGQTIVMDMKDFANIYNTINEKTIRAY